jgi:hypothetical protein
VIIPGQGFKKGHGRFHGRGLLFKILFLVFQIVQRAVCHTNLNLFLTFLFFAATLRLSKRENKFGAKPQEQPFNGGINELRIHRCEFVEKSHQ